jgi:tetratricopeptide (TPR) repeat protein/S1-C subfamily serine protease
MKNHYLLLALTVGAFGIAATKPWLANFQPTQIAQASQMADNSASQANPQIAKSVAAKVTVRIGVGQGLGSGVLLGKKGSTYLVLTNAHVVREEAGISIQTPDGQSYTARKVKDPQVGNFDVALLEFTSTRTYQLAKLDVSSQDKFALSEGNPIFAAGFARDSNALNFLSGAVKQLPQEPFVNGTQVGYATKGDIEQGMSGGPILDKWGNLVGINSTYAYPIKPVYTYADGSKAPPDKVAEYRQANWGVPIYNLLTRLNPDILYSYKQLPKLHRTVTPSGYMAELDRKARLVTVRIEYGEGSNSGNGSGVIVARDGNSYSVLTAEHVLKKIQNLRIITHDQRTYTISPSDIKRSEGTDVAIVKFTSTQPYQVATLGNYSFSDGASVFPGGWPAPWKIGSQQWQWQINPGTISNKVQGDFKTQDIYSFSNGYDLLYSSVTYGGMSGGPVFDSAGRVIGIHGKAEGNGKTKNVLGNSLGISMRTFLGQAARLNVSQRSLRVLTTAPIALDDSKLASVNLVRTNITPPTDERDVQRWIEYGNQLYRLRKYDDAVKAFEQAIALEPNSVDAHYGKGLALSTEPELSGDDLRALKAFDRAIELVPLAERSKFYYLWKYRSISLMNLRRYPESLVSISEAISLEPQDIMLMNHKADVLRRLDRASEAIDTYNKIITNEPKGWAYNNRGYVKSALGDKKGAIADYDLALGIYPQSALIYCNRGNAKSALGDKKGAIADYEQAIGINPKFSEAKCRRL